MVVIIIEKFFFPNIEEISPNRAIVWTILVRLTIGATLGNRTLASTPPHGDTVDDISLKKHYFTSIIFCTSSSHNKS